MTIASDAFGLRRGFSYLPYDAVRDVSGYSQRDQNRETLEFSGLRVGFSTFRRILYARGFPALAEQLGKELESPHLGQVSRKPQEVTWGDLKATV